MAGLDEDSGHYRAPATAACIGGYLKKIALFLIGELIKKKNRPRLQDVKDFLQLLDDGLTYDILKTVNENQLEMKRNKNILLPSTNDINCLRNYLDERIKNHFEDLNIIFSKKSWTKLGGALLVALQLFNRRRVGEIERVKIQDFLQYKNIDHNEDNVSVAINNENYVRFLIRGKRGRGVPVLVDKYKLTCLKTFLKYRRKAGVPQKNPYLFGIEGANDTQHLEAGDYYINMHIYVVQKNPERLKGTELRKHFATKCSTMDLEDIEVKDIADYMGHHRNIHLEHYRMPIVSKDIRMSRLLEKAQGVENGNKSKNICSERDSLQFSDEKNEDSFSSNTAEASYSTPKSKGKRKSWGAKEKQDVSKHAELYLKHFESPTISFCASIVDKCPSLKNRTPKSVKAFIMNEIKKQKLQILKPNLKKSRRGVKKYWTTEEKQKIMELFEKNLKNRKLPSLAMCKTAIAENNVLKDRTPEMIKAYLHNNMKKCNV
ncbi:hypothetical protein WA026_023711 [Henosepilachna vigintioctopunctata]|uniref:BEN domain-containing protein n=1 Tax=Henosepilachna vigintioctopunctata TaxID=420089 RepID=A0AAW1UGZ3_9CUCU